MAIGNKAHFGEMFGNAAFYISPDEEEEHYMLTHLGFGHYPFGS